MEGVALNYGQGEGQIRINNSIWGIYINDAKNYYYILEEENLSLEQASEIAIGILVQIRTI